MKFRVPLVVALVAQRSLPARGAWIEIRPRSEWEALIQSLPARGAWIEIIEQFKAAARGVVAPRTGGVD